MSHVTLPIGYHVTWVLIRIYYTGNPESGALGHTLLVLLLILVVRQHSINLHCYRECIYFHLSNSFVIFLNLDLIIPDTWYPTLTRTIIIHNFTNTKHIQFVIQPLRLSFSYNQRLLVIYLVAKDFY